MDPKLTKRLNQKPQFYVTDPAPCPYIEGQKERKAFTHLFGKNAPYLNNLLTQNGFRRSQFLCLPNLFANIAMLVPQSA